MMIAGLTIERAVPADLRAVHALEQRCFPAPWRREFFESELTNDGRFNLVARHEGAIAGYLFAMWFADEMHINKIAVEETLRRQGIALALMQRGKAGNQFVGIGHWAIAAVVRDQCGQRIGTGEQQID